MTNHWFKEYTEAALCYYGDPPLLSEIASVPVALSAAPYPPPLLPTSFQIALETF